MTLQYFGEEIRKRVQKNVGSGHEVECRDFLVNNGERTLKLTVTEIGRRVGPAFTLNGYYKNADPDNLEAYLEKTAGEIAGRCLQREPLDILVDEYSGLMNDFSAFRDKIKFKLIHTKMNRELLETIPHIPFLDLSIVFYMSEEFDEGLCSVLVHNELAVRWGVTSKELHDLALKNTPKLLPPVVSELKLERNVVDVRPKAELEQFKEGVLYPVSNYTGFYGAAVLAYPNLLRQYAQACGKNIIVIPSSVHEVLIKTEEEHDDRNILSGFVNTVNAAEVSRAEWLSDHIYVYEYETDRLIAA